MLYLGRERKNSMRATYLQRNGDSRQDIEKIYDVESAAFTEFVGGVPLLKPTPAGCSRYITFALVFHENLSEFQVLLWSVASHSFIEVLSPSSLTTQGPPLPDTAEKRLLAPGPPWKYIKVGLSRDASRDSKNQ